MRMNFDVQTSNLGNSKDHVQKQAKEVLWRAMVKMEGIAKKKAPVDRGTLKAKINLQPKQQGASEYTLSDGVVYGIDLEYGNRPHNVAWEPIEQWVKRKGIRTTEEGVFLMTRYVVEKIRTEGVNAQPFFRPAFHEVQNKWLPMIKKNILGKN